MKSRIKPAAKCAVKPTQKELWEIACKTVQLQKKIFPDVYKFINAHKSVPAPVMIEVLLSVAKNKPADPWAYAVQILKVQAPNFYMAEHTKKHNEQKLFQSAGDVLRAIMERKDADK